MSGGIDHAVGMMDGAYFTSRRDILDFLNDLLQLNLSKIEQTASGAVACQLTEYMFPGSVPMKRVNWEARSSHEFVQNYKLLQAAFNKNRVQKYVDVDKLIRAKYQDNLEFCQWLKAFYEQTNPPYREDYDPVAIRAKGKGGKNLPAHFDSTAKKPSKPTTTRTATTRNPTTRKPLTPRREPKSDSSRPRTSSSASSVSPLSQDSDKRRARTSQKTTTTKKDTSESIVADAQLIKDNADLKAKNAQLYEKIGEIERERDFYFEKLRDVEMMLQIKKENGTPSDPNVLFERLFKVLYATADEKITIDEESGELSTGDTRSDPLPEPGTPPKKSEKRDDIAIENANEKENLLNGSTKDHSEKNIFSTPSRSSSDPSILVEQPNGVDPAMKFLDEFFGSPLIRH